jgi:hypothetical protein
LVTVHSPHDHPGLAGQIDDLGDRFRLVRPYGDYDLEDGAPPGSQ